MWTEVSFDATTLPLPWSVVINVLITSLKKDYPPWLAATIEMKIPLSSLLQTSFTGPTLFLKITYYFPAIFIYSVILNLRWQSDVWINMNWLTFILVWRWWIFCYLCRDLGAKVSFLSNKELSQMYPWLNVSGVVAGVLGRENEGWWVENRHFLWVWSNLWIYIYVAWYFRDMIYMMALFSLLLKYSILPLFIYSWWWTCFSSYFTSLQGSERFMVQTFRKLVGEICRKFT